MYIPVDVIAAAKTKLAPVYYAKNIKTQKDQYGKDFFSNQGAPGINIGLAKSEAITQKYEISVTATFGCDKDKILSATCLKERSCGEWRYRVGDNRILADIEDDKVIILILTVGHRRKVYR